MSSPGVFAKSFFVMFEINFTCCVTLGSGVLARGSVSNDVCVFFGPSSGFGEVFGGGWVEGFMRVFYQGFQGGIVGLTLWRYCV